METVARDLGIDFHSDRFTADYFEGNQHRKITYLLMQREEFFSTLQSTDTLTIEAMTGTFAFVREIGKRVGTVNIVNPGKFNIMTTQRNKTDGIDARALAEAGRMGRFHINYKLARVHMVSQIISELRSLISYYQTLVASMTIYKNRIHAVLKDTLNPFNKKDVCSSEIREQIINLPLSEGYKIQIASMYRALDSTKEEKKKLIETVRGYAKHFKKEVQLLISISGISIFSAMAVIADYGGDLGRFKNAKHFCSYMGTAPRIEESNQTTKITHVNKASRKYALGLILQGIHHIYNSESRIAEFHKRKKAAHMQIGKLRMADARKVMTAIYYMLKKEECYYHVEPINYARKLEELKKIN